MKGNPNIHKVAVPFTTETAKAAQQKGVEARRENKARNEFSAELAQKILNAEVFEEGEKETLEGFGIQDGVQWQSMFVASVKAAKEGNYKAYEFLMKLARLYVEKTETKNENVNKNEFANLAEWKEFVKSLNE